MLLQLASVSKYLSTCGAEQSSGNLVRTERTATRDGAQVNRIIVRTPPPTGLAGNGIAGFEYQKRREKKTRGESVGVGGIAAEGDSNDDAAAERFAGSNGGGVW